MHTIYGDLDYVQGYLRMGHLEMKLNDKDFEKFKSLSLKEQKEWLRDEGAVKVDDFSVDMWLKYVAPRLSTEKK